MEYFYHDKSGAAYRHLSTSNTMTNGGILAETNQRRGFLCVANMNEWVAITPAQFDEACSGFRKVSRVVFL